ncbi:Putative hypothetical protein with 2 PDZ domains and 3 NifX/NifB domains. Named MamT* in Genebank [Desulfamplus magnetovallimortis]|uniref:PDZ domain-containing protein n=2 Tax=Desulfamplus magnetovallimortis TaxID=1246637 RepID=L0R3Y1_9BACT|nr:NifB/NifX family molybdenum-iron cluster-binding protein [Desulfamplus magnetovallimortis]AET24924.1 magnetosome protein [Desulfamplus magnetovallimortis BW-1]CCO06713.1 Putative hypothetical protein with 2 PDZ domains and 3 NifX/NifB domains. Named MamT* in Genebank [Desulfamplus magnetovallimortis BW-1]SLM32764.1 Putative hypothetical protein with 2 PDZ domains and 3 NifX/NifB domains. Named MamT* in Genebank [Desulfamplus magnetovallimortis]
MENDLNSNIERVSAEEKRILSMKRKMKWWTAGLIMLALVALGLFSMVYFPGAVQKLTTIRISFGDSSATRSDGPAYLGIEIRDLPKSSSFFSSGGILVSRVAPASPADESGLKAGDIILRYNRIRITDTLQFQAIVAEASPGDRVKLTVERDEKTRYFYLVLSARPTSLVQLTAGPPFSQDDNAVEQWGCTLSPLTASLRQTLAIPLEINGIVVVSVSSSGLAKASGLMPGDIITGVNQRVTATMADFYSAIEDEEEITLKVYRSGSMLILTVEQKSALPPLVTIAGAVPDASSTAGMPETIPPPGMGQATAGMPTAGTATDGFFGSSMPRTVAIASQGSTLNAPMALRFGTAPYFIIVDTGSGQYSAIQNTALADSRGYGIIAAQLVASKNVGATIAGSYGLQAYTGLVALNITPYVANPGSVIDVLNQYREASLSQVDPDDSLSGFGYARNIIPTGGAPFATDDEDDEEEEQSGYKGMPYNIPAQGKYDPALDPANASTSDSVTSVQATAGVLPSATTDTYLNLNQQSVTCICPLCGKTYDHPAGVPCSSLVCPADGSRLISLNSGSSITSPSQGSTVSESVLPQRVAVAADGDDLNSPLALRFGIAKFYIIYDIKTNQYAAIPNTALNTTGGYGVTAAQLVASRDVGATVAVAYGLPSYYALKTLGINVYTAAPGSVATVLSQYRAASLSQMSVTTLPYAQYFIPTGGAPFATDDEDDEEEEQSGYKGMPYNIPAQGKYDPALDPANASTESTSILPTAGTTQRAEYCLCPICQILVPHAPGISCSDMACPQCGNRLMNADPGQSTDTLPEQGNTTGQLPLPSSTQTRSSTTYTLPYSSSTLPYNSNDLTATQNQTQLRTNTSLFVAGMPTAGMPTAGMPTAGMPETIPPTDMGQGTAGTPIAGMPTAGSSTLSTGVLQGTIDGSCICPACGTTVPHVRGTACSTLSCPRCGTSMIGESTSLQVTAGMPTAGMPTAGMPTAGMPTAGMPTAGMPTAGMPTAGMPETIPPPGMGQSTAGMPTAGMPETLPPTGLGETTAGLTVAGIPDISQTVAGVTVAGMPTAGMPTAGMPTAGMPTAGMPETLPPTGLGETTAGLAVAGIPNISQSVAGVTVAGMPTAGMPTAGMPTAGMPTAGMPETIPPPGMGIAGVTVAGMPETIPPADMGPSATSVAGSGTGKICVASTGTSINSKIADLFEKAPYFLIIGFGSMEVVSNPNLTDKTGSGIQSAQLVVSEGADVVITNDIGIRAIEELNRLQVKVYTGVTGTVRDALDWYQNNRLVPTKLNSSQDTSVTDEDEEQHGPPSASKSKSKGDTKGDSATL